MISITYHPAILNKLLYPTIESKVMRIQGMPPTNLDISNNILMCQIDQKMMIITLMKLTSIKDCHIHLNQKEQFDFVPIIKCKK